MGRGTIPTRDMRGGLREPAGPAGSFRDRCGAAAGGCVSTPPRELKGLELVYLLIDGLNY